MNNIKEIQEFVRRKVFPNGFPKELETRNCRPSELLTLARILNTFNCQWKDYNDHIAIDHKGDIYDASRFEYCKDLEQTEADLHKECQWKFLNKDGSEVTFQDQTEETQIAIAKLLGWEGEDEHN